MGPKYHPPVTPPPSAANYKESPVNFQDTKGWKVASPQDAMLRGKWWEVFNDPDLNALEEQLNINNQNIKEFFQNFMEARTLIAQSAFAVLAYGECQSILDAAENFGQPDQLEPGQHGTDEHADFVSRRGLVGSGFLGQDPQPGARISVRSAGQRG